MTPGLLPIDPEAEKRFLAQLWESPFRASVHNKLVRDIESQRDLLENCAPAELLSIQSDIRAKRNLISWMSTKR